jgi:Protein of unknown function (DUF3000)
MEINYHEADSAEFRAAVESLRTAELRDELVIQQIDAPADLATNAMAFTASISDELSGPNDQGTGRFVLMWEPKKNEAWASNFRVVCFGKSPLEAEIGADDLGSDVAWAWLIEALTNRNADYAASAGTATRIISRGYGTLSTQHDHAEIEVRASWSPLSNELKNHFEAWQDFICIMSGFAHLPAGVTPLAKRVR